ncbi:MAG: TRAP transporter large permease [Gracilibacteraceae bacterium]|jgi:C4-dicarboxylate transporter DctM subunit|nr:TRAP transporter large permease [Gracilibacteraceae bacterium]
MALLFLTLLGFMMFGVPIAASIGLSSLVYILAHDINIIILVQRMFTGIDSIVLVAIPCFIVAGAVMEVGGLASRLMKMADSFLGFITGGLSIVTITTCMFFAAISGSNVATTAAVGGIMVPEMKKRGYDPAYSATIAAAGGVMGVIIPPSLSMVLYSSITGTSLSQLFMAGIPVGVLMAIGMSAVCYINAKRYGYAGSPRKSGREMLKATAEALWALGTPVIMIGGIMGGFFTPTEAAVVAVIYGVIVSIFVYKEIKIKDLYGIFLKGAVTSAKIMFIMANAAVFGWLMASEQIPLKIFTAMNTVSDNPIILLLMINGILLIAGCFMETGALLIIITPILIPFVAALNLNPVHFGLMVILNLSIGNLTPPLGVCLYTGAMVAKCRVEDVSKRVIPFLIVLIGILLLVTYIPEITMFLPQFLAN